MVRRVSTNLPPILSLNVTPYQATKPWAAMNRRRPQPPSMVQFIFFMVDGWDFIARPGVPSEIMNHFGRKGSPQGVQDCQNVDHFLGDSAVHRT
jgi:hypothetical protein